MTDYEVTYKPAELVPGNLLAVVSIQGSMTHIVEDDFEQREKAQIGNMVFRGRALCGAKGKSGWLPRGGIKSPVPALPYFRRMLAEGTHRWSCSTCHYRAKRL